LLIYIYLIATYDDSKILSGDYKYFPETKDIIGNIDIPPYVVSYDFDENFIIAKQAPTEIHNAIYRDKEYIYKDGKSVIYYWIIIHDLNLVLGPLNKNEYEFEKINYKVPKNLRFMY